MRADKVARLAAEILGVGESRVWIDSKKLSELEEVVSKSDVRRLIDEGIVKVEPKKGNSRARWKVRHEQRKKGRRRGYGKTRFSFSWQIMAKSCGSEAIGSTANRFSTNLSGCPW